MTEEKIEKTYIADKRVKGLRITEFTTPLGGEIVEVQFEDGSVIEMPKKRYDTTRTYKQSDATRERDRITEEAAHHILAVLHEWGVRFGELNNLLDAVVKSVQRAHDDATHKLWGVGHDGEQDLNQIKRVLGVANGTKKTDNTDGSASAGGGANS
jgi:hypothetical protein